jgi:hypothetical protein
MSQLQWGGKRRRKTRPGVVGDEGVEQLVAARTVGRLAVGLAHGAERQRIDVNAGLARRLPDPQPVGGFPAGDVVWKKKLTGATVFSLIRGADAPTTRRVRLDAGEVDSQWRIGEGGGGAAFGSESNAARVSAPRSPY